MKNFVRDFCKEEQGQDIVEYALLLAFAVVAYGALFPGTADKIGAVWSTVNTKLEDSIR